MRLAVCLGTILIYKRYLPENLKEAKNGTRSAFVVTWGSDSDHSDHLAFRRSTRLRTIKQLDMLVTADPVGPGAGRAEARAGDRHRRSPKDVNRANRRGFAAG